VYEWTVEFILNSVSLLCWIGLCTDRRPSLIVTFKCSKQSETGNFKAWLHNGEILREKLCQRNTDSCTWLMSDSIEFSHFFPPSKWVELASTHWWSEFLRSLIYLYCACTPNSFLAKFVAFCRRKRPSEIRP
jgi:hypothetical protein